MSRRLVELADQVRAIATTGLHYTEGSFDRERYEQLLSLAAEVAAAAGAGEADELAALYRAADSGYVTPKLDVRLALFRDDRVLLVRERADGRWCMPGGFIDIGETPSEAAVRETHEEAGVSTRVTRLVGVFDNRTRPDAPPHLFHIYKLVFAGELLDPSSTPRPGSEADRAEYFPLGELPELSGGRTLPHHIDCARAVVSGERNEPFFD